MSGSQWQPPNRRDAQLMQLHSEYSASKYHLTLVLGTVPKKGQPVANAQLDWFANTYADHHLSLPTLKNLISGYGVHVRLKMVRSFVDHADTVQYTRTQHSLSHSSAVSKQKGDGFPGWLTKSMSSRTQQQQWPRARKNKIKSRSVCGWIPSIPPCWPRLQIHQRVESTLHTLSVKKSPGNILLLAEHRAKCVSLLFGNCNPESETKITWHEMMLAFLLFGTAVLRPNERKSPVERLLQKNAGRKAHKI